MSFKFRRVEKYYEVDYLSVIIVIIKFDFCNYLLLQVWTRLQRLMKLDPHVPKPPDQPHGDKEEYTTDRNRTPPG